MTTMSTIEKGETDRHRVSARRLEAWTVAVCVLLAAAFLATPATAAGLLLADGGFGGQLEIVDHDVHVMVNNGIAVTEVEQTFRNLEDRQVEALYVFPVPANASVSGFSMWIEGKEMVGEVLEKKRAREIYDSYKQQRRDPGLLEQADHKRFEMRIFPIAPRAEQRVRITYYQELEVDHDWATYVYPLATVSEPGVRSRTVGRFGFTVDMESEIPITSVGSPSHGAELVFAEHSSHDVQASMEVAGGDLGRDVVVSYHLQRPRTGFDLVGSYPAGEDGYFLLTFALGDELAKAREGMDYVFVLDISGSMDQDGKLAMSREQLVAFIDSLDEEDRFEVMTFNVMAQPLFGQLRDADDGTKGEAGEFLASQRARGGTFLRPALEAAFRYAAPDRPLNVVVLSDGMTEQQERQVLFEMIDSRPRGASVFAIGVGNEVDRGLLEQLAEDAGGLAAFLSRGDDFERRAAAFRRKLTRPAATNVEIELLGGDVYDLEPRRLPALYHGSPLRLYGRYRRPGSVTLRLVADIGGERLERELQIELPGRGSEAPEIERMWAWHRVQRLLKAAEREGSRARVVDEIVRLGEAYSIATEHTSFLVLENDGEFRRWKIERRNALRIERDRRHQDALRRQIESLRQGVEPALGPVGDEQKSKQQRAATPASRGPASPSTSPPSQRGWDLDPGGSGAVGPLEALAALALLGLGARRRRRR